MRLCTCFSTPSFLINFRDGRLYYMRHSIKYETIVMVHKKEFKFSFCGMMGFSVLSFIYTAAMQWGADQSKLPSADILFMGSSYSYTWAYYIYFFAFVIVLPYSFSYISDIETGVFHVVLVRSSKAKYYLSKIFACFLGNVLIIAIPLIVNLILCHMTFSSKPNFLFGEYGMPNYFKTVLGTNFIINMEHSSFPLVRVFLYNSTLYNLLYIGWQSFISGMLGVFLTCMSFVIKNRAALFVPVYVLSLFSSVASEASYSNAIHDANEVFVNYNFMDYLAVFGYPGQSLIYLLAVLSFLLILSICAFAKAMKTDEIISHRVVRHDKNRKKKSR